MFMSLVSEICVADNGFKLHVVSIKFRNMLLLVGCQQHSDLTSACMQVATVLYNSIKV